MNFIVRRWLINSAFVCIVVITAIPFGFAQSPARDPGVRGVANCCRMGGSLAATFCGRDRTPSDPTPIAGLSAYEEKLFCAGADEFAKVDRVKEDGLGPTMNLTSCLGCHQYPTSGGSSPLGMNPQYDFAKSYPAGTNVIPPFVLPDGPVKVARFKKHADGTDDGGVHALFTITGLKGAEGCNLTQPDFAKEIERKNIIYRIPTPTFGAGLIEQIEDQTIDHNVNKQHDFGNAQKIDVNLGKLNFIRSFHTFTIGSENRSGNDGTIARFGWKAQNKSLLIFAGEAYNVEMGISNEVFPTERKDDTKECQFHTVPNDTSHPEKLFERDPEKRLEALSDVEKLAAFMRFLAPPEPSMDTPGGAASIARGFANFQKIGCSICHTPELQTSPISAVAALRNKPVRLYSDLALHNMGSKLADDISQGQAEGNEFRSAPLWGLGQRVFFLHDGRTKDLVEAIYEHDSSGSDAKPVIDLYKALMPPEQQDLLNFLRSL